MFAEYDNNAMITGVPPPPPDQTRSNTSVRTKEPAEQVNEDSRKATTAEAKDEAKRTVAEQPHDTANVSFSLSQDERNAIGKALDGDGPTLSEEEREAMKAAAERITKAIDEAIAKNKDRADRVNKAVSEWYSRLSNGEGRSVGELIKLLREAAAGNFDNFDRPIG